MHKVRVLVVDDNPLFLSAARNLLSELPEVGCAEYVTSGAEALAKATEFGPDLVLMDIMMPGINGLETIAILQFRVPVPRIYAVTLHDAAEYRTAVLKSGADGLISKTDFATAIPELLAALARGDGIATSIALNRNH
jgi:DNA-binding NarL/FixJ family response regulator